MDSHELDLLKALMIELERRTEVVVDGDQETLSCTTGLTYPDGTPIEVFVTSLDDGRLGITDFGETMRWLSDTGRDISALDEVARDVCNSLGLTYEGGAFSTEVRDIQAAANAILAVESAASRVGDVGAYITDTALLAPALQSPARTGAGSPDFFVIVADEIARHTEVERDVSLRGRSGRSWKVSALLPNTRTIVEPAKSRRRVPIVFTEFSDLVRGQWRGVAVLDDEGARWREEDVELLRRVGEVEFWSDRDEWLPKLVDGSG